MAAEHLDPEKKAALRASLVADLNAAEAALTKASGERERRRAEATNAEHIYQQRLNHYDELRGGACAVPCRGRALPALPLRAEVLVTVLRAQWHASPVEGVHSFALIGDVLVEVRKARSRRASRRRVGWHTHWYVRVTSSVALGPWRGDDRQLMHPTSLATDGRLGFRTMRAARAAAKELAS